MAAAVPAVRPSRPGLDRLARECRGIAPAAEARASRRVDLDSPDALATLVALARAAAPLRRALAKLAGRLERLRAWEPLGFARRRDYAAERLGISGRQLQELSYMDRAFGGLPAVEQAFLSGELSFTQVRLLARVATPDDAPRWIAHAAGVTARELSREVRAVDARAHDLLRPETDEEGESEGEAKETVFVHCTPRVRAKWHRARFLASRQEGHPVPAWKVAEQVAAEALSAIPLDEPALRRLEAERACEVAEEIGSTSPDGVAAANGCATHAAPEPIPDSLRSEVRLGPGSETSGAGSGGGSESGVACGTPAGVAPANGCATQGDRADARLAELLDGLDEADVFELDRRLRRALDAERRLEARMGPALLAVARRRLYRDHGCSTLGEFAREWLGLSPRKAEALVRLERAGQIAPTLAEAYRAGRLSWVQAQILVRLVTQEGSAPWHAAWVEHAARVTVRRLEDEVSRALALGAFEPPPLDPPTGSWDEGSAEEPADPAEVAAPRGPGDPEPQTGARPTIFPRSMSFFFTAPRDVAQLFRGALATVQRRIEHKNQRTASESEALDAMLEHAFETWQLANSELQREHKVFERDGWRCTFPGCTSYGNLQDHHLEYRSHGGSNALSNRTSLCLWHHLRGEHAKILRCRGRAPARLRFELGLRRGRPPLARYRSGDVLVSQAAEIRVAQGGIEPPTP